MFLRAVCLCLLQVKENELEHERKIEEAIRKMEQLNSMASTVCLLQLHFDPQFNAISGIHYLNLGS